MKEFSLHVSKHNRLVREGESWPRQSMKAPWRSVGEGTTQSVSVSVPKPQSIGIPKAKRNGILIDVVVYFALRAVYWGKVEQVKN